MSEARKKYDSTVARIAGNIMSGMVSRDVITAATDVRGMVYTAVSIARSIVAEVERTEIPNVNGTLPQGRDKA